MATLLQWLTARRISEPDGSTLIEAAETQAYSGTWIVGKGPPRCGKTHAIGMLAPAASLEHGLPLIAQDVTGNLAARFEGFRMGAYERWKNGASISERLDGEIEYEFFSDRERCRIFSGSEVRQMHSAIERLVGNGQHSTRQWQGIVMLDEGAIIRQYNPEFFDRIAPLFGNAGLLGYVTEQREVGVPPSLRECVRYYLLWQSPGRRTSMFDFDLDNRLLTSARSQVIIYLDPMTGELKSWDSTSGYPMELITPAALSLPIKATVLK